YRGLESTLCAGCGHDSISAQIISACYELGVKAESVIKLSGIGCSSKSPAYFRNRSFGFNTLHGRMPSVATGALTANHLLQGIAVSGDGDTGSIGLGQFKHLVRRNVRMLYIIENNGVYGLTKGQFSATADQGQELKYAGRNELPPIDLCLEAMMGECGFVARSFAGDPKQVVPLLKAALSHRGTALLDIISPCVTFNNRDDSTKSYAWGKNHDERINDFTYVPPQEEIRVDYAPGTTTSVELHDGSSIVLKKLDGSHDPTDRYAAMRILEEAREKQQFITGLIYVNGSRPGLAEHENLTDTPLVAFTPEQVRPSRESLDKIMAGMK
ncbi:MAG TPA: 2-oxoacid:ferredoxin oxidoreductase subunit beta, partial [Chloroflexia bacterium]|nr:2-oxoacid:ferredoxin oxidoreductase subunit beta [Chloroflexia bacterium]